MTLLLVGLLVFGAATSLAQALLARSEDPARLRLRLIRGLRVVEQATAPSDQERFAERIVLPLGGAVRRAAGRIVPWFLAQRFRQRLAQAGHPVTFQAFVGVWGLLLLVLPGGFLALLLAIGSPIGLLQLVALLAMLL